MEQRPKELELQAADQQDSAAKDSPEPTKPTTSERVEAEDEGFDASEYVRQLISRMESGEDSHLGPAPGKSKPKATQSVDAVPSTSPLTTPGMDTLTSLDLPASNSNSLTKRPRTTPEQTADLAKLREAANLMASSALHAFDCKSLIRRAYSHLALSVGSMGTSLVLLTMSDGVVSVAFVASVAMLVVSAAATYRYAMITRVLGEKNRPTR